MSEEAARAAIQAMEDETITDADIINVVDAGGGYTGSIGTLTNPVGAGTALDYGDIY